MDNGKGKGKAYYTQRNNRINPGSACNVTAMVAALSAAGWPVGCLGTEKYPQPEDSLMDFILTSPAINEEWKEIDPDGKYPPNQWHALLAMGTNLWLRRGGLLGERDTAVEFGESRTLGDITEAIAKGGAAVLSGVFTMENGQKSGHVVAAVGFEEDCLDGDDRLVLDDSWGDYTTRYRDKNGKGVRMAYGDYLRLIKDCGSKFKMAHIVRKYGGAK